MPYNGHIFSRVIFSHTDMIFIKNDIQTPM